MRTQVFSKTSISVFIGLSTDDKPLDCPNGSKYAAIDTGKLYRFDASSRTWYEQPTGGGGGGGTVIVDPSISTTSENPVQNKVIAAALDLKLDAADSVGQFTEGVSMTTTSGVGKDNTVVTETGGANSERFGDYTHNVSSGQYSRAEGMTNAATGYAAHAEGQYTLASGSHAHSEGTHTTASGTNAHAEGGSTVASGDNSHAEGYNTEASWSYAHAEGNGTKAQHNYTHAEGSGTKATKEAAHAEGSGTIASGKYSHAEGGTCTASGQCSHAEGGSSTASASNSHAEGQSIASGGYSHSEGKNSAASGEGSHSEGWITKAVGKGTHAEGRQSEANADWSHAEGYQTRANSQFQHVQGYFNEIDAQSTYALIIGNGTADDARHNAFAVDWSGLIYVNGDTDGVNVATLAQLMDDLPQLLYFKGTIASTGATISTLPAASSENAGYAYKVIENGTYSSIQATVGDVLASNGEQWVLIPSTDEGGGGGEVSPAEKAFWNNKVTARMDPNNAETLVLTTGV